MTRGEAEQYLETVAAKLGEHFDAVQLMASSNEEGCSHAIYRGAGNWYARQGMAREFIEMDSAQTNAREIARAMPDDDDGGEEDWQTAGDF